MSATQPIGVDSNTAGTEAAVRSQLDLLSKGEIDHLTFLENMKERFRVEPDDNWEVLSLLDQYYRRGKINLEVFRALKSGFAEYILGPQISQPSQRRRTPDLHTVVTPTTPDAVAAAAAPPAMEAAPTASPAQPAAPTASPAQPAAPAVTRPVPAAAKAPASPVAAAAPPEFVDQALIDTVRTVAPSIEAPSDAAAVARTASSSEGIEVGDVLRNRYRIDSLIATGAYGVVFEASDPLRLNMPPTGKRVAVKVVRSPDPRGTFMKQLRQEFHHLQLLSHPNIVRVFDFDRDGELAFFTMELLSGAHLNSVLRSRGTPLPRPYALAIIRDVGGAIAYAHSRGISHGGINPQNILITTRGEVRVLGFGTSHESAGSTTVPNFEQASPQVDAYRYASCEVLQGGRPDPTDDLYSLSCLSYLLLTGNHPFADSTSIAARTARRRPARHSSLSQQQWRALRAGLQTDARKRPSDVQTWLQGLELDGAANKLPPASELADADAGQPRRLLGAIAIAGVVIAALLVVAYELYTNRDRFGLLPKSAQPTTQEVSGPTAASGPADGTPAAAGPAPGTQGPVTPPSQSTAPAVPATAVPATAGPAAGGPAPQPPAGRHAPAPKTTVKSAAPPTAATAASSTAVTAAPALGAAHAAAAAAKIEMAVDTLDASPTDTVVHVTVRRKGNLHGQTSFTWWTESGTAKPGIDFSPVLPHLEQMDDGQASVVLSVPLLATVRSQPRGFYVGIDEVEGGARVVARSLTQITLPPTN